MKIFPPFLKQIEKKIQLFHKINKGEAKKHSIRKEQKKFD